MDAIVPCYFKSLPWRREVGIIVKDLSVPRPPPATAYRDVYERKLCLFLLLFEEVKSLFGSRFRCDCFTDYQSDNLLAVVMTTAYCLDLSHNALGAIWLIKSTWLWSRCWFDRLLRSDTFDRFIVIVSSACNDYFCYITMASSSHGNYAKCQLHWSLCSSDAYSLLFRATSLCSLNPVHLGLIRYRRSLELANAFIFLGL